MIVGIDHVLIGVRDLAQAVERFGTQYGLTARLSGSHPSTGTSNALVHLSHGHVELITVDELDGPDRSGGLAAILREREGLVAFALKSDDLDADAARLVSAGLPVLGPQALSRVRPDGLELHFRLALVGTSFADLWRPLPFVVEWGGETSAFGTDPVPHHPLGAVGVAGVTVAVDDLDRARDTFVNGFGLSPEEAGVTLVRASSREGVVQLEVAVDDLDAAAAALRDRGTDVDDLEHGEIRLVAFDRDKCRT